MSAFRFAIGEETAKSETWSVSIKNSDVYITAYSIKHLFKISLHESGICHVAYHNVAPLIANMGYPEDTSKTICRWKREATPVHGPTMVFSIYFASFNGWRDFEDPASMKNVTWLSPPSPKQATQVAFVYSKEDPSLHCGDTNPEDLYLFTHKLANGDHITLFAIKIDIDEDFFVARAVDMRAKSLFVLPETLDKEIHSDSDLELFGVPVLEIFHPPHFAPQIHSLHNMMFLSKKPEYWATTKFKIQKLFRFKMWVKTITQKFKQLELR